MVILIGHPFDDKCRLTVLCRHLFEWIELEMEIRRYINNRNKYGTVRRWKTIFVFLCWSNLFAPTTSRTDKYKWKKCASIYGETILVPDFIERKTKRNIAIPWKVIPHCCIVINIYISSSEEDHPWIPINNFSFTWGGEGSFSFLSPFNSWLNRYCLANKNWNRPLLSYLCKCSHIRAEIAGLTLSAAEQPLGIQIP